jgi:hypothetical protein
MVRAKFTTGGAKPAKTGAFRYETEGRRAVCAANRRNRKRIGLGSTDESGRSAGRRSMAKVYIPDRERLAKSGYEAVAHAHGVELRQWLGGRESVFQHIKTALNNMRVLYGKRPLFWPSRPRQQDDRYREPQDEEAIKRLFHELRHQGRAIKRMFAEGEALASLGVDPRSRGGEQAWSAPENRAWLIKHLLDRGMPGADMLADAGAKRLRVGPGAQYQAPGLHPRYMGGLVGGLRWFVPAFEDMAVLRWIFMIGTGWNPSTCCGIDVLDPEGWSQPHPHSDLFAVIHAFKRRSDRHQFAISMKRPEWHPYSVLVFAIEITAPLRRHVLALLDRARVRASQEPSADLDKEIHRLEGLSRTPWLYASNVPVGTVAGFMVKTEMHRVLQVARDLVESSGLAERHPSLESVVAKDARLAWIGHAYVHSNYDMLLTKFAGNHATFRSTSRYIRSHRYRAYSEEQVRKMQDAMFGEVAQNRILDPTRLRILVEHGTITAEQEARLADYRQRTRLGMGCLDPRSPPKQIAPDHPENALCRVQRCTGCPHGVVFPDSMPPLARRFAELLHLKRTMPVASWTESSLADEQESIEQTLTHFDASRVSAEIASWTEKLCRGEIAVHGTYPSY